MSLRLFCDFGFEGFSGFESRNFVSWDDDSGVLADIASSLLCTLFELESTEAAKGDFVAMSESLFHNFHEFFNGGENARLFNAGALGNLSNNFSFSHICNIMGDLYFVYSILMIQRMLDAIFPFLLAN